MNELSKVEETVLIAIWQLGDDAYGYRIRKYIMDSFQRDFSIGHLYSVLNQLDKKEYVERSTGAGDAGRRGKPKIYYLITGEGKKVLDEARRLNKRIWAGIPDRACVPGDE